MSQRISGAMLSYLLILVRLVITLLFTPFLVSSLGTEGYGLYALAGAMAAYLYILDFGMNDSVLRFFVAYEKDADARDSFLARMLGLYGLLGLLALIAAFGLSTLSGPIFGAENTAEQVEMLRVMILLTGAGVAVLVALNPIGALLSATESFLFLRGMEICVTLVTTLAMVAVLYAGYGPVQLVMVSAVFMALQALLKLAYARLRLGVRIRWSRPVGSELRTVLSYALPILVSVIAELIFWKFDAILIGAVLGIAPVAVYSIGVTFNKYFMSLGTALSRIMTPEIVRRIDKGAGPAELTDLMIRLSRIQACALLLILGGLIVFGQRFLTLWLGPEFTTSYWVMLAVLGPYTLELTGNARNIILQVKRLYWQKSGITLSMAAMNIPLTLIFLNIWGVVGAAISTGIAIFLGYLLVALLLKFRLGMEMGRYWSTTARGILPVAAGITALGLLGEPSLPGGWAGLLLGATLFSAAYGVAAFFLALDREERLFFQGVIRRLWTARGMA